MPLPTRSKEQKLPRSKILRRFQEKAEQITQGPLGEVALGYFILQARTARTLEPSRGPMICLS